MIAYHTAFDLWYFYHWDIHLDSTVWTAFRITTASVFLFVSGISSQLSAHPFKRALVVLACAIFITGVTYINDPRTFIYFGILHCIGIGMLLLILLKRLKEINIFIGLILILLPPLPTPYLLPPTLDYYPLLPWFGVMLIGSGVGYFFYIRNHFQLLFSPVQMRLGGHFPFSVFHFFGRRALLIYMIHQPIILSILYFLYGW